MLTVASRPEATADPPESQNPAAPERIRVEPVRPDLPVWPLTLLFAGFPVFWLLGLGAFAAPIAATTMIAHMMLRGGIRSPRGYGVWLLFLIWMFFAGTQIDTFGRGIGFVFRSLNYGAATVIFLYVFNSSRVRLPVRRMVGLVTLFWVWVVIGGFLGVLMPKFGLTTPFEMMLPKSIASNDYVRDLVHPRMAEIQQPWGAPTPYNRPRAPFPYTNAWGSHYALLFPFVVLMVTWARPAVRFLLVGLMAASLVPAFATLNRGMFLAVVAGVLYTAVRYLQRGHVRWPAAVIALMSLGGIVALLGGVVSGVSSRTTYSSTSSDRIGLYVETFVRTLDSPILGYGAPRPSEQYVVSVGTQGQFWNVMFSYGFPGLALFCGCLWLLAWRTRRVRADRLLWLHAVLVMCSFMLFYYGLDQTELVLIFIAAALVLREPQSARPGLPGVRRITGVRAAVRQGGRG
ncbi:O-antigen ligase family protein [Actinomadura sp. 6N118]|uniref:O-antigen ligase family protein n=1 Tax=Actinomadura sp. 6N118 TaxID=3375151 RepID=UPI0037B93D69